MAKYRLQRYEVSTDNGETWSPVTPEQYRKGELLDNNTGCEVISWRIVIGEYVCEESGDNDVATMSNGIINTGDCTSDILNDVASLTVSSKVKYIIGTDSESEYHSLYEGAGYDPCETYRWIDTGETICYNSDRYTVEKQQKLDGDTWIDTGEYKHNQLIGPDSSCNVSRWVIRGNTEIIDNKEYFIEEMELSTDGGVTFVFNGDTRNSGILKSVIPTSKVDCVFNPQYRENGEGLDVSYDCGDTWNEYYRLPTYGVKEYLTYELKTDPYGKTWTKDDTITELIDWTEKKSDDYTGEDYTHLIQLVPNGQGSSPLFAETWKGYYTNSFHHIWSSAGGNTKDLANNAGIIYYPTRVSSQSRPFISIVGDVSTGTYEYLSFSYYWRGSVISGDYYYSPSLGYNTVAPWPTNGYLATSLEASSILTTRDNFVSLKSDTDHWLGLGRFADTTGIFYVLYDFTDLKYTVFRLQYEETNPIVTQWVEDGFYTEKNNVVFAEEKEQMNYNNTGWVDTGNVRSTKVVGVAETEDGEEVFNVSYTGGTSNQKVQFKKYNDYYLNLSLTDTEEPVTEDYTAVPVIVEVTGTSSDTAETDFRVFNTGTYVDIIPSERYQTTGIGGKLHYSLVNSEATYNIKSTNGVNKAVYLLKYPSGWWTNTRPPMCIFYHNYISVKYLSPLFYRVKTTGGTTYRTYLYSAYEASALNYLSFRDWGYTEDTANMTTDDIKIMFNTQGKSSGSERNFKYPLVIDLTGAHDDFKAKVRAIDNLTSEIIDND